MTLLALSFATDRIGYAIGGTGEKTVCGAWTVPNHRNDYGRAAKAFENQLYKLYDGSQRPARTSIMLPHYEGGDSHDMEFLIGLRAIAAVASYTCIVTLTKRDAAAVAQHMIPGRTVSDIRRAAYAWAAANGVGTADQMAATAAMLLHYELSIAAPKPALAESRKSFFREHEQ